MRKVLRVDRYPGAGQPGRSPVSWDVSVDFEQLAKGVEDFAVTQAPRLWVIVQKWVNG